MYKLSIAAILVGFCVVSMAVGRGVDSETKKAARNDPSDLNAAVADLKEKVAALEERVEKLEKRRAPVFIDPRTLRDRKAIPKDWRQREFNGMPYYIVPLEEGHPER